MGGEFDETRGNGVRLRGASEADETTLAAFMRQLREDDPEEGRFDEALETAKSAAAAVKISYGE